MERLTAIVVLVLGGLFVLAAAYGAAVGEWETNLGETLVLLVVIVGMWRAVSHLRRPSGAASPADRR